MKMAGSIEGKFCTMSPYTKCYGCDDTLALTEIRLD